jgi:MFS family permease
LADRIERQWSLSNNGKDAVLVGEQASPARRPIERRLAALHKAAMTPVRPSPVTFPLLCALAYAGGVIGYVPFLTLLLPIQVARVAGTERFGVLALVLTVGAVAAGGSNILFGWLSDRSRRRGGNRRRWMAAGLVATLVSFAVLPQARTPLAIAAAVFGFQVAINALLAPMMVLVAEEVSEGRMGLVTGLFAAGPPLASLLSLGLAASFFRGEGDRLVVIGAATALCVVPLLLTRARPTPVAAPGPPRSRATALPSRDLALVWVARLLVQVAGAVLFSDLLYLMEEAVGGDGATIASMGTLLIIANLAPVPVSILFGRWSDRVAQLKPFLAATIMSAAAGLVVMAVASTWSGRGAGFLLFSVGLGSFMPLQIGTIMQLLPRANRRGRDLGIMNLANTLPMMVGQLLTWLMATPHHGSPLLITLAAVVLAGGAMMLSVRECAVRPMSQSGDGGGSCLR